KLVIAGPSADEEYRRHLQSLAGENKAATLFTGMLTGDLKWGALHAAEAFVLPSHQENFGIAVAEALGCGVPVLITNKINIWREIQASEAGLVSNDDRAGTIALLERWLALSLEAKALM